MYAVFTFHRAQEDRVDPDSYPRSVLLAQLDAGLVVTDPHPDDTPETCILRGIFTDPQEAERLYRAMSDWDAFIDAKEKPNG